MTTTKPLVRPARPHFSSGPCAKIPGWSPALLESASVGRSHRSGEGKARLKRAIDLTREVLQVPDDHLIGIVPASDTGAVEMVLWSVLGQRGVDVLAWESFGEGWVTDVVKQLKLADARTLSAPYGRAARPVRGRLRPRRGLHLERHDLRRARARRGVDPRRPRGPHDLRRHLGRLRAGPRPLQARRRHLLLAEGHGRRGRPRRGRARARGPWSGSRATPRPGPSPRSSA